MEFAAYLSVTAVCVWLLYWSVRNSSRKPGTPISGLFTYREGEAARGRGRPYRKSEPGSQSRV